MFAKVGRVVGIQQKQPRLCIHVEARDEHDGDQKVVLIGNHKACRRRFYIRQDFCKVCDRILVVITLVDVCVVPKDEFKPFLIIRRIIRLLYHERGHGKRWQVLNVGIVFNAIANHVMSIVILLPPSIADTRQGTAKDGRIPVILLVVATDIGMAQVVTESSELLPKTAHEHGTHHVTIEICTTTTSIIIIIITVFEQRQVDTRCK